MHCSVFLESSAKVADSHVVLRASRSVTTLTSAPSPNSPSWEFPTSTADPGSAAEATTQSADPPPRRSGSANSRTRARMKDPSPPAAPVPKEKGVLEGERTVGGARGDSILKICRHAGISRRGRDGATPNFVGVIVVVVPSPLRGVQCPSIVMTAPRRRPPRELQRSKFKSSGRQCKHIHAWATARLF